jgi:hypothetical protein
MGVIFGDISDLETLNYDRDMWDGITATNPPAYPIADITGSLSATLSPVTLSSSGTVEIPVSTDTRVSQFVIELIQQAVAQNVSVTQLAIEIIRTPPVTFSWFMNEGNDVVHGSGLYLQ